MIQNIPLELQALPQWVVASGVVGPDGKRNKKPLNPATGNAASPTDRATWGTFEAAAGTGYPFLGFVLSPEDAYTIIDLDDPYSRSDKSTVYPGDADYEDAQLRAKRHGVILELFKDTYTELSVSGKGFHIIVRGRIPKGVRRDNVEIYSDGRYMICTGHVFRNAPIVDHQEALDDLFKLMDDSGGRSEALEYVSAVMTDQEVLDMAMRASNADKFNMLCAGRWQEMGLYESQSEADLALMTIIAYYTRDNDQAIRLFRYSGLGQREKAQRDDYFIGRYGMLNKIRGKQPPLVDLSSILRAPAEPESTHDAPSLTGLDASVTASTAEPLYLPGMPPEGAHETASHVQQHAPPVAGAPQPNYPPGFVGEVAQFITGYATRPNPTYSIAAAIALTAGIVGRSYNISRTGLNHYVIALGGTGTGKDAISQGIDALISAARHITPMIDQFIGPAAFGSGQGLLKSLDGSPCYVSILGEFGITLQQISHPKANNAETMVKKVLLDLYSKSGWHQTLRSTVYSDKEKNTKMIQAPALTIIGEGNPEDFYGSLTSDLISSGLIPRFLITEYKGPRPEANKNPQPPSELLVRKVADLAAIAINTQQNAKCAPVAMDAAATATLEQFNQYVDKQFDGTNEITKQLWNRAHLKALKLAALLAVGVNPHGPVITDELAHWAICYVLEDVRRIVHKFESGETGQGHGKQYSEVVSLMDDYLNMPAAKRKNYKCPAGAVGVQLVPLAYLTTRVRGLRTFNQTNGRTPRQLLEGLLKEMVEEDVIALVPLDQCLTTFRTKMPLYKPGVNWTGSRRVIK